MICELEAVLDRGVTKAYVTNGDCITILESIALMHKELYNGYKEFQEAGMVLDGGIKFRVKELENRMKEQEKNIC